MPHTNQLTIFLASQNSEVGIFLLEQFPLNVFVMALNNRMSKMTVLLLNSQNRRRFDGYFRVFTGNNVFKNDPFYPG